MKKVDYLNKNWPELILSDQVTISYYESGQRKLSVIDLPKLAQALNVPILYFFGDELNTDSIDQTMLFEFQRLSSIEFKETAIDLIRSLAKLSSKI